MNAAMHVLVVEDDVDVSETLVQVLETEGHVVFTAKNGQEALDALHRGFRPDVILLDLMMPGMDGWQFRAEQLREASLATIPVVVVSAFGHLAERARTLGAAGFLHKPFDLGALLAELARLFRRGNHE